MRVRLYSQQTLHNLCWAAVPVSVSSDLFFISEIYAPDIWRSSQWVEQRAIEKSNRTLGQSSRTVHTDTFPVQQFEIKVLKLDFTFFYLLQIKVRVSFNTCASCCCSMLNQILSLNWLMACFKTRLSRAQSTIWRPSDQSNFSTFCFYF